MVLPGESALMYCVKVIPLDLAFCIVRKVILLSRSSSGTFRRTKVRLSANTARRKSRCQLTAGGGEGGGQDSYGTTLVSHHRRTTPPSAQGLHAPVSADGGRRDVQKKMCVFLKMRHSDKRPV